MIGSAQLDDGQFVTFSLTDLVQGGEIDLGQNNLLSMDIAENCLGNNFASSFLNGLLPHCEYLTMLDIGCINLTSIGGISPLVAILTQQGFFLKSLSIAGNKLDMSAMALLGSALGQNDTLEFLTVSVDQQHLDRLLSCLSTNNNTLSTVTVLLNSSEADEERTDDLEDYAQDRSRLVLNREDLMSSGDKTLVYAGQLMTKPIVLVRFVEKIPGHVLCQLISKHDGINSIFQTLKIILEFIF